MRNRMYGGVRGRKTRVGEKLHRFPPTRLWGPRKFLICGESGGIGRLNDDGVISQCNPIAEHDLYTLHPTLNPKQ